MNKWKIECRQGPGSGTFDWFHSKKPYVEIWSENGKHIWSGYIKILTAEELVDKHNEEVVNV